MTFGDESLIINVPLIAVFFRVIIYFMKKMMSTYKQMIEILRQQLAMVSLCGETQFLRHLSESNVLNYNFGSSSGERWSRGRAPDCQSRGRWFNPTYRHFET